MKKFLVFILIVSSLFINYSFAGDELPTLKDIFKSIVDETVKIKSDLDNKQNKSGNSTGMSTGDDYKSMEISGTYSANCDEIDGAMPSLILKQQRSNSNIYDWVDFSNNELGKSSGKAEIIRDTATNVYRTYDKAIARNGAPNLNLSFILLNDGYVRMIIIDNEFKIQNVLTKCSFNHNKNNVKIKQSKNESLFDSANLEQVSKFEIKDLTIGSNLPNGKCPESNYRNDTTINYKLFSYQEFDNKSLQRCTFNTTILDVPYLAKVHLLNGKITNVNFEGIKGALSHNNISDDLSYWFKKMEFSGDDSVKNHIDTFVTKVSEKLGEPKTQRVSRSYDHLMKQIEIEKKNNENTCKQSMQFQGYVSYETCMARFDSRVKKLREIFTKLCGKCEYTEYIFNWDGDLKAELIATVPEYKNSPGILTDVSFKYSSRQVDIEFDEYLKRKKEFLLKEINSEQYIKAAQEAKEKYNLRRTNDF